MSVGWSSINPALIELFSAIALPNESAPPTPAWLTEWKDRPLTVMHTTVRAKLYLTITSCIGLGEDEQRFELVPTDATGDDEPFAGQLRETITGQRKFTLNLRCDAMQNTDAGFAFAMLERVRTRIRRGASIAALDAVEVALIRAEAARNISSKRDQHILSQATMDLIFGTVASDDNPVPVGWIETIVFSTKIQNVDGVLLPSPPNITNETVSAAG